MTDVIRTPESVPTESPPARNTVGSKYIGGGSALAGASSSDDRADGGATHRPLRVLASGVDSLYASVPDRVDSDRLAPLLEIRERAALTNEPQTWEAPGTGMTFLVGPRPQRSYSVRLSSDSMDLWVGIEGESNRPPIYIELRSLGIHSRSVEGAVVLAQAVAAYFCPRLSDVSLGDGLRVSRIDLYADVQGWTPTQADDHRFATRGRDVANRHAKDIEYVADAMPRSRHRKGCKFSGFTFGHGKVSARIYNKSLQMAGTGHDWMTKVWKDRDPDQSVWRIEVQFRRAVLTEFRTEQRAAFDRALREGTREDVTADDMTGTVSTVLDALNQVQALWDYGVGQWLTLRRPSRDTNKSRWPLDPVWREVQAVRIGSPCEPLVRQRDKDVAHERLMQGLTGYMTSLVAHPANAPVRERITANSDVIDDDVNALPIGLAVQQIEQDVRRHLGRIGRRFMDAVTVKGRRHRAA